MNTAHPLTDLLVESINTKLDIPWVDEDTEAEILRRVITHAVEILPESIAAFLLDAADGLTQAEIDRHIDLLVNAVNARLDIPWVPESVEDQLLHKVADQAIAYIREKVVPLIISRIMSFSAPAVSATVSVV